MNGAISMWYNYLFTDMSKEDDVASVWCNAKPEVLATYQDFSKKKHHVMTREGMVKKINEIATSRHRMGHM